MNELIDDTPEDFGGAMDVVDTGDGAGGESAPEFSVDNEPDSDASFVAPTEPGPERDDGLGAGTTKPAVRQSAVVSHPKITDELKRLSDIQNSLAAKGLTAFIDPADASAISSRIQCLNTENAKSNGNIINCKTTVAKSSDIEARAASRKAAVDEVTSLNNFIATLSQTELTCKTAVVALKKVYDRIECLNKTQSAQLCQYVNVAGYNQIRDAVSAALKNGSCTVVTNPGGGTNTNTGAPNKYCVVAPPGGEFIAPPGTGFQYGKSADGKWFCPIDKTPEQIDAEKAAQVAADLKAAAQTEIEKINADILAIQNADPKYAPYFPANVAQSYNDRLNCLKANYDWTKCTAYPVQSASDLIAAAKQKYESAQAGNTGGDTTLPKAVRDEIAKLNKIVTDLTADGVYDYIPDEFKNAIATRLTCLSTAKKLTDCVSNPAKTYQALKIIGQNRKNAAAKVTELNTILDQVTAAGDDKCAAIAPWLEKIREKITCLQGDSPATCGAIGQAYNTYAKIHAKVLSAIANKTCTAPTGGNDDGDLPPVDPATAATAARAYADTITAWKTSLTTAGLIQYVTAEHLAAIDAYISCLNTKLSIPECASIRPNFNDILTAADTARSNQTLPNVNTNPPPPNSQQPYYSQPQYYPGTGAGGYNTFDIPGDYSQYDSGFTENFNSDLPDGTYSSDGTYLPESTMTDAQEKQYWDFIAATPIPAGCKDVASQTRFKNQVKRMRDRVVARKAAINALVKLYGSGKVTSTDYASKLAALNNQADVDRQCGQSLRDMRTNCQSIPLDYCAKPGQKPDEGNFQGTAGGSTGGYYSTNPDGTGGNIPAGYYLASDGQIYPVHGGTQYPPVTGQTAPPGYYYSNGQLYQIPQGYYKASNGQIYQIPQGYTVGADGNLIYGTAAQGTSAQTAYCSTTTAVDQYGRTYRQCQYNDATGFHIIRKYQDGSITQQASDGQYYPLTQFPQSQQPYYQPSPYGYPQPAYPQYQTQYDQYGNPISQGQNYPAYNQPYQQYPQSPYYGGYQTPPQNINSPGFEIPETPMDYQSQDMFEQAAPYSRYQGQGGMNLDSQGFIYPAYSQDSYVAAAATDPYQSNTIYYGDNGTQEITQVGQPGFLIPETESIDL